MHTFFRLLGLGSVAIAGLAGGACAIASWDKAAEHPVLAAADLSPLIATGGFYADTGSA